MIIGIDSFKEWFKGYEEQYVIIGGTACDILMSKEGLDFRSTKDIDLVLIVEAINAEFGIRFWNMLNKRDMNTRIKTLLFLSFIVLLIHLLINILI